MKKIFWKEMGVFVKRPDDVQGYTFNCGDEATCITNASQIDDSRSDKIWDSTEERHDVLQGVAFHLLSRL